MNTNKYDKYTNGTVRYTSNGWVHTTPSKYVYNNTVSNSHKGCGLFVMAGLLAPVVAYLVSTLIIH